VHSRTSCDRARAAGEAGLVVHNIAIPSGLRVAWSVDARVVTSPESGKVPCARAGTGFALGAVIRASRQRLRRRDFACMEPMAK